MEKKEMFKEFVKKNPKLLKYVKNNEMTWQGFYEIYDMYGEDNNAWKEYLGDAATATASTIGIADAFKWLKNIDLDSVQEGVKSIERVLGVFSDLSKKDTKTPKEEYKARPLYKHFED